LLSSRMSRVHLGRMETYVAEKPCDEDISCMSMSNVNF
jgi:hypothetical protein